MIFNVRGNMNYVAILNLPKGAGCRVQPAYAKASAGERCRVQALKKIYIRGKAC